jgi:hypothetical protein
MTFATDYRPADLHHGTQPTGATALGQPPTTARTRRRLTATARPFAAASDGAPDPRQRLRQALAVLRQERAPGGDYYPGDDEILTAWAATRERLRADRELALDHLDHFLRTHLGTLRDLMQRACFGRAPAPLLDELEAIVAAELRRLEA